MLDYTIAMWVLICFLLLLTCSTFTFPFVAMFWKYILFPCINFSFFYHVTGISRNQWKSERCCDFFGTWLSFSLKSLHTIVFLYDFLSLLSLQIDQEREGEQIDRALLKNVLDIFVEIGLGSMDCYENDFEAAMLKDTAAYYSRKASNWILEDSCPDYMLKVVP